MLGSSYSTPMAPLYYVAEVRNEITKNGGGGMHRRRGVKRGS